MKWEKQLFYNLNWKRYDFSNISNLFFNWYLRLLYVYRIRDNPWSNYQTRDSVIIQIIYIDIDMTTVHGWNTHTSPWLGIQRLLHPGLRVAWFSLKVSDKRFRTDWYHVFREWWSIRPWLWQQCLTNTDSGPRADPCKHGSQPRRSVNSVEIF
jgi:hypothetical protein